MAGVLGLIDPPAIATERLVVSLARPGMQVAMAHFLRDNFAGHLDRWSPPAVAEYFSVAFWAERLAVAVEDFENDRAVRFVLQPREDGADGRIIGTCNYTNIVRGAFHACHLGYQIGRDYEGRGLMAEGLRAANAYMFDVFRMHRIMANFRPENARSRRLLERLGFLEEGFARSYLFIDGTWRDHVLTSLIHPAFHDAWITQPAATR